MPPAAKKDVAVIVFDLDRSDKKFYQESLNLLFDINSREWFFSPKNLVKLLLLNSEESKNCLHKPNILEVTKHFVLFNPNIIKEKIEGARYVQNKAVWVDAISVGLAILGQEIDTLEGIVSAQLVLISKNYSNVTNTLNKDLQAAIKTQNKYSIKTIIVGPSISVGFIRDMNELKIWAKNPVILDKISKENEHALRMMCNDSETLICDLNMGRDLFCAFRTKTLKFPWKASLSIGSSLEIPTSMYRLLEGAGAVSVRPPPQKSGDNYFTWVCLEDETRTIAHDDVVHGVFRWGKFVAFEEKLKEYFKIEGPKNFTLRGFTKKSNVPESILLDGTLTLAPDSKDPHSQELLYLLYKCLLETDSVGIASKTYARNYQPTMVALVPDKKYKTILVNNLPYADDIISTFTEQVPENTKYFDEIQTEEEKEVFEFVNSLRVPIEDFHLGPELSVNPRSVQISRKVAEKYLERIKNCELHLKLPSSNGTAFELHFPETKEKETDEEITNANNNEDGEEIEDDYLL